MSTATLSPDKSLQIAMQHHEAGRFAEAEAMYRQILSQNPNVAQAQYLLGMIALQFGHPNDAVELIGKAIAIKPAEAVYHVNLGHALTNLGQTDQAIAAFFKAIQLRPDAAEAHHGLGNALRIKGNLTDAAAACITAIQLKPKFALAHNTLGTVLKEQGKLTEAEASYRAAIEINPSYGAAYNNLSLVYVAQHRLQDAINAAAAAIQVMPNDAGSYFNRGTALLDHGKHSEAIEDLQQAIRLAPSFTAAYCNLGKALLESGKAHKAIESLRKAITLKPDFAVAYICLGAALEQLNQMEEALAAYSAAARIDPSLPEIHNNIGNCLVRQGRHSEAETAYRAALKLKPDYTAALSNLGGALRELGKLDEAVAVCQAAISLAPTHAQAYENLGAALHEQGHHEDALAWIGRAITINPERAEAHTTLGNALRKAGNIEAALTAHRRAIELQPELASAYNNLGSVFIDQGQAEEAIRAYRNALACSQGKLDSCRAQYHSALIYTLHLHPDYDGRKLFTEASQWSRQNAEPLAYETVPHRNNRSPDRKLKIGYVSSDFSMHPVGRFMLPIIEHHDRNHFELHIFSNVKRPDDMTTRFQQAVDFWHDIRSLTDAAAAELIRKFGIDILIDLGLHTGDNRLLIFARKPAPVQATYLAYCGTSGMRAMDYLICDPHLIPTDANTACFSEKLSPLPNTYWCYRPPIETGDVGPLPALTAGHITFGCLNNFGKISANALDIWCQLLKAVPGTTLLLHAKEGSHRQKVRDAICAAGIDPARLDFVPSLPLPEYFDLYHRVDIGLDPFPFTGGTTSCDSIWMGVPVITLAGQTPVSRGGLSILSNVGLTELVAHSMEEYLRLAIELATDLPRLSKLRATLRDRMRASPLMQEQKFTADLESAYRSMWKTWCAVITVFDNSGA